MLDLLESECNSKNAIVSRNVLPGMIHKISKSLTKYLEIVKFKHKIQIIIHIKISISNTLGKNFKLYFLT